MGDVVCGAAPPCLLLLLLLLLLCKLLGILSASTHDNGKLLAELAACTALLSRHHVI
jgi:hypothetical protein